MTHTSVCKLEIILIGAPQPVECPVCKFLLRDKKDVLSVKDEQACTECVTNFKYIHYNEWIEGWRPSLVEARDKLYI